MSRVKRLFDKQKFQKSKTFVEGSGHPNFTNPFEYDKSLQGKSFSKRIGARTPPNLRALLMIITTMTIVMTGKLCQVPLFRLNSVLKQPGRRDEEDEEPERQQWDK